MNRSRDKKGLFSFREPLDLFEKVKKDWIAYDSQPSDDRLLNVLFGLSHLRDWIWPDGHNAYRLWSHPDDWPAEARIHHDLWNDKDYRLIHALCNRAKHRDVSDAFPNQTQTQKGFVVGCRVGDRLDIVRHEVEGIGEVRNAARNVYRIYLAYFQ